MTIFELIIAQHPTKLVVLQDQLSVLQDFQYLDTPILVAKLIQPKMLKWNKQFRGAARGQIWDLFWAGLTHTSNIHHLKAYTL